MGKGGARRSPSPTKGKKSPTPTTAASRSSAAPATKSRTPAKKKDVKKSNKDDTYTDTEQSVNTDSVYFDSAKKVAIITKKVKKKEKKRKPTDKTFSKGSKPSKPKSKLGSTTSTATSTTSSTYLEPGAAPKGRDKELARMAQKWLDKTLTRGVRGLLKDYARLRAETNAKPAEYVHFTQNQSAGRNRYEMVYCLDKTRVVLRNHPKGNDYIHANFVNTPDMPKRFICTQAPMHATAFDFWWMVLQEHVDTIVMLGKFCEDDVDKCYKYFPQPINASLTLDNVDINCTKCEKQGEMDGALVMRRTLKVKIMEMEVVVQHYHWEDWPDFDVPDARLSALHLLHKIRVSKNPVLVHCSAGVGRTGTFVAIECIVEKFCRKERFEDIADVVKQLRKQRAWAVQKSLQFLFIHRVVLLYLTSKKLVTETEAVTQFIADYEKHRAEASH